MDSEASSRCLLHDDLDEHATLKKKGPFCAAAVVWLGNPLAYMCHPTQQEKTMATPDAASLEVGNYSGTPSDGTDGHEMVVFSAPVQNPVQEPVAIESTSLSVPPSMPNRKATVGSSESTKAANTAAPSKSTVQSDFPAGFEVGTKCTVNGYDCKGVIRFLGLHVENGKMRVGVELDKPIGKHSGTPKGTSNTYFTCAKKHGILVAVEKVQLEKKNNSTNAAEIFDGFGGSNAIGTSKKKMTQHQLQCTQMTSSGPCLNEPGYGLDRCDEHTCSHVNCRASKSSKEDFCSKHAARTKISGNHASAAGMDL